MRLRDPQLLADWMKKKDDMGQARLGRHAECSRQFIHLLLTGQRTTCTPAVAKRIEEALDVVPGTLFVPRESPTSGRVVAQQATEQSGRANVA